MNRFVTLATFLAGTTSFSFGQNPHISEINSVYGLSQSELVQVEMEGALGQSVVATFVIDGTKERLLLTPKSVRAENFQLLEQLEDGSLVAVDPGPVSTYEGIISNLPGAQVVGGMQDSGLFAKVVMPHNRNLWLQPISRDFPGADEGTYVIYDEEDIVEDTSARCGVASGANHISVPVGGNVQSAMGSVQVAELGCDADFEYFQDYGSVANASNRIQNVIGVMNNQYESQVSLTHVITAIIVRSNANDPYTSNDAGTTLNQFRAEWLNNQGGIQRDVAHLFTGKNINGGTIGVAFLGAICSSFGFGLVESDFSNNFACVTDLSAHELGHNWGGNHCNCTNATMNPFITCANNFNNFSINEITAFAASINCLSTGDVCIDDNLENNDNCNNAVALTTGIFGGLVASDNDSDFYEFVVGPFGSVEVNTLFLHAEGDLDVNLTTDNCAMVLDSGTSASNNESVSFNNTTGGNVTVKLEVFQFTNVGCTDYALDVSILIGDPCTAPDDSFEPNDSCAGAVAVGNLGFASGFVVDNDPDYYEVCVAAGDNLAVSTFFAHADGDIDLRLFEQATCGGTPLTSSLSMTNTESFGWTNNTGVAQTYVIEVTIAPTSQSDCNSYLMDIAGAGADCSGTGPGPIGTNSVSYTHLRAHETSLQLVCRLLLEKKKY